jgi:hypothetical protein
MAALQGSHDYPPFIILPFNPADLGPIGNGLSVPNPKDFYELPSLTDLAQVCQTLPPSKPWPKPLPCPQNVLGLCLDEVS